MSRIIFPSLLLLLSLLVLCAAGEEPWLRIERCHSKDCGEDQEQNYHCEGNKDYFKVTNSCVATKWGSYVRNTGYHYNNHALDSRAFFTVSNKRCRDGLGFSVRRGCDADRFLSMTLQETTDSKLGSVINMTFCYDRCGVPKSYKNRCAEFLLEKKKMNNNCVSTGVTSTSSLRAYMNVDKDGKETGKITMSLYDLQCTTDVLPIFMVKDEEFNNRCYNLDNSKEVEEVAAPPAAAEPAPTELVIEGSCSSDKCNDCKKDVYKVTDGCVQDDERGGSYEASCTPDGAWNIDLFADNACQQPKNVSNGDVHYFGGSTTPGCYNRLLPPTFTLRIVAEEFRGKTIYKHFLCPGDEECKTEDQTNPNAAYQVCKDAILMLNEGGRCQGTLDFREYDNTYAVRRAGTADGPQDIAMYLTYDMCFSNYHPIFEKNGATNGTCVHTKPFQRVECKGPARYNYTKWNSNSNNNNNNNNNSNNNNNGDTSAAKGFRVMGAVGVLFLLSFML